VARSQSQLSSGGAGGVEGALRPLVGSGIAELDIAGGANDLATAIKVSLFRFLRIPIYDGEVSYWVKRVRVLIYTRLFLYS
jgi:hypothetical protein